MNLFEKQSCEFITRHIGPDEHQAKQMLKTIGEPDLDSLLVKQFQQPFVCSMH